MPDEQLDLWGVSYDRAPDEPLIVPPEIDHGEPDDDATPLLTLRDYQRESTDNAWRLFHVEHLQKLLGVAAMGAGKTVMFADLARREVQRGGRALILVDQDDLVGQAVEKIRSTTGILADIEQASRRASLGSRVVVSTIQTMRSRLDKWPANHFGLAVADEADRSLAAQWMKVLTHFDAHAKTLGVTATPNRADRKDLMTYYQAKAFDIPLAYLIQRGFLSRIKVRTIPLKIDVRQVAQKAGDYDAEQLSAALKPYFRRICEAIVEHASGRKVLVFHPLIHTSQEFVEIALDMGIAAKHIDGGSPDRRAIQLAFRERRFSLLSNAMLLSRGYDDPSIDCVVNLRLTRHRTMYEQIIGRGTRIYCPHQCPTVCEHDERKRDLLVLDFLWMFERFDIMRPAQLLAKDAAREKKMTARIAAAATEVDLLDVEEQANLERERELLEEFQKAAKKKAKTQYFDALEWAATLRIPNLVDYEPETAEDLEPVTDRQAKRLAKAGFVVETVKGRAHAQKIIDILDGRMRAGLATFKQVHWLRKFGVEDAMSKTMEEATAILDEHFGKGGKKWWFRRRK